MRLLIVGTLKGQLTTATKIAMDNGASVTHAEDNEQAMRVLRGGKGADLLLVDVALDIRDLVLRLETEHIHVPIVACGISSDARAAVAAIHAGAKEYIPLPPDPELIAAVLAAVANDSRDLIYRDEAMAKVIKLAQQIAGSDASVMITGRSRADRRGSRRGGQRFTRPDLSRRGNGQGDQARPTNCWIRRLRHDHRRIRHRQGSAGALCPHPLEPRQAAVHLDQLRRDPRAPAGVRTVRPREGCVHRCGGAADRKVRGSDRRHAATRRNFGNGRAPA